MLEVLGGRLVLLEEVLGRLHYLWALPELWRRLGRRRLLCSLLLVLQLLLLQLQLFLLLKLLLLL